MNKGKRAYSFNDSYDLDELYNKPYEDTDEERLRYARDKHITHIRLKTIISGDMLESEAYPVWDTRSKVRASKKNKSRDAQRNLNNKNAIKNIVRLINTNFTPADVWFTGTFKNEYLPQSWKETSKYAANFIRRLKRYAEKNGYGELKYLYVCAYTSDTKKKIRAHVHLVINFPDRDVLEDLWHGDGRKKRRVGRTQARRLQPDEFGLEGLARYLGNNGDPQSTRRYVASKNLKRPTVVTSNYRMTRGRVEKIIRGTVGAKETYEKLYKGYAFTDMKAFTSDYCSGNYIYVRMRRQN